MKLYLIADEIVSLHRGKLFADGEVVAVEPCEHGKIDEHVWHDGGDTFVGDGGRWLDPANYTRRYCKGANHESK